MRCFIALPLPESARLSLSRAAGVYRRAAESGFASLPRRCPRPRISWTKAEGYHITLAFLGEIEGAAVDAAAAALDAAAGFGTIACGFAGLGGFPQSGRAPSGTGSPKYWRLLFAGIEDEGRSAALHRLVNEALADGARRAGLDGRPFLPHVTLARAGPGPGIPAAQAAEAAGKELSGAWTIERCALYKSELQSGGSVYTEIRGVDLSGK